MLFQKRCTLPHSTGNSRGHIQRLSFVVSTVLSYMVPCVLLVVCNILFSYKLICLNRRRIRMCRTNETKAQLVKWTSVECSETDRSDNPKLPARSESVNRTVQHLQQRSQAADQEARRECRRLFVLIVLSGIYVCFTFPLTVMLAIRALLQADASECQRSTYAHLTRLLTSVKDINYAINGYIYACFFTFYYKKIVQMFNCCISVVPGVKVNGTGRLYQSCNRTRQLQSSADEIVEHSEE